ncbi:MAG TPA: hypothetical protein VH619_16725 [Verrucomicrobiae bacterium]|jgi:hypothetical protein|nr:hypothetical protein [Verrucomicrobiae bacterium]
MDSLGRPSAVKQQTGHDEIWRGVNSFLNWIEAEKYESHDPYDVWGTKYGLFARRLYYKNRFIGAPLILPLLLAEIVCPHARVFFTRKQRFATADAQLVLAFSNLYSLTSESRYLYHARALAGELLQYSIPGYSGYCWGYPFDWQHNRGLWERNTPFITATPYCYEAFVLLYEVTGEDSFLEVAKSIARFVQHDLQDVPTSSDAAAGSYSPRDDSQVINASAYRAMVLYDAAAKFNVVEYEKTAERNLNFILQTQRDDGAWLYAHNNPAETFIDHFHTCFVLKNLWKLNRRLRSSSVAAAISRGYEYYRRNLFGPGGLPRSFSVKPRMQLARYELYDFAEAINLGALLRKDIPEAFEMGQNVAETVCRRFQLPDGHFVTRVYGVGIKHVFPFLRWPQAQMFHALTRFLLAAYD